MYSKLKNSVLTVLSGIIVWFAMLHQLKAQDPEFSQFYSVPTYLNPALTGSAECTRIIANFRDQWPTIKDPWVTNSHAYTTYALSYDEYFDIIGGGIGVRIMGDHAGGGLLSTYAASASYAYRLEVNQYFHIQAGLEASVYNKSMSWGQLVFDDQLDPRTGLVNPNPSAANMQDGQASIFFPDFSAGIFAYETSYRLYGGMAFKHLTQPRESLRGLMSELPMRFTVHGGGMIYLKEYYKEKMFLAPDILYTQQGDFKQFNAGIFWSDETFFAGLWARFNFGRHNLGDAIIPRVGFRKDIFKITYSYDATYSRLGFGRTWGAHEIALELKFCEHKKGKILCPRFW